jgi:hypothetical protein
MKLFLCRYDKETREAIHGVDYMKGVPEGGCGTRHEFHTRECHPVVYTEEEKERLPGNDWVELVPFRVDAELTGEITHEDRSSNPV